MVMETGESKRGLQIKIIKKKKHVCVENQVVFRSDSSKTWKRRLLFSKQGEGPILALILGLRV